MANRTGSAECEAMSNYVGQLFVRAIRTALLRGIEAAVKATKHDSSQAAAHWLIAGADGRSSRPWQRKLGRLTYLRGGVNRAPMAPVGYRHDEGKNAAATVKFVSQKELNEVINQLVSGRRPEFRFYLYNAVGEVEAYSARAGIDHAGEVGVAEVIKEAEKQIALENTRKVPLR